MSEINEEAQKVLDETFDENRTCDKCRFANISLHSYSANRCILLIRRGGRCPDSAFRAIPYATCQHTKESFDAEIQWRRAHFARREAEKAKEKEGGEKS